MSKCFHDTDIRSAPYMENLVSIYRSLDATFANISLQILSSGMSTMPSPKEHVYDVKSFLIFLAIAF